MNRSLSINIERVPQAANDPLETKTWAALRIYAGSRCVTRWMTSAFSDESDTIYVPVFAVAQWVVRNWWFILHEPCPTDIPPAPLAVITSDQKSWMYRHCLRSADAGLFLPRLLLWNDGRYLCAGWSADPDGVYDRMPGSFLYGSMVHLNPIDVEDSLREFITTVLRWIDDSVDERAIDLKDNWKAINSSSDAEAAFARSAAKMGLDPYALSEWPSGLPELLEASLSEDVADPIANDFLAVARQATAIPMWKWVRDVVDSGALAAIPKDYSLVTKLPLQHHAGQAGVIAAHRVRQELDLDNDARVEIADVAKKAGFGALKFESHNHRPDNSVKVAVGWQNGSDPVIIGPPPPLPTVRRFVEARGLFHALFTCGNGPRLVTRGHDWDQQASRGFAAELLAPRTAMISIINSDPDYEDRVAAIASLAKKYEVGPELIAWQLENAERLGYVV
jgi:hypothetical protein